MIFNWIVRQNSVNIINIKPQRNTGISLTAPVFFNGTDWKAPQPLISNIYCRIFDNEGQPLKNTLGEVWNIDERVAKITTDEKGSFRIEAPATIDVRFVLPDGQKEQQWHFMNILHW